MHLGSLLFYKDEFVFQVVKINVLKGAVMGDADQATSYAVCIKYFTQYNVIHGM